MCKISTLPLSRSVKCGKERVEKNLHLLTLDKKGIFCVFSFAISETNSAGGEVDEVIVMTNNGVFCDRTTRGVQSFIAQLLSEWSVLSTINITERFHAKIARI